MKTWIPRILQDDGMLPMCEAPSYAKCVTQYVRLADCEQALAEKDQQYQQLMAQAVRFAQYATCNRRWQEHVWDEAQAFLKERQP